MSMESGIVSTSTCTINLLLDLINSCGLERLTYGSDFSPIVTSIWTSLKCCCILALLFVGYFLFMLSLFFNFDFLTAVELTSTEIVVATNVALSST